MLSLGPIPLLSLAVVVSVLTAITAVLVLGRSRLPLGLAAPTTASDARPVFLFEGHDLVDASPAAEDILAETPAADTDWARVVNALGPQFPQLTGAVDVLERTGAVTIRSQDGAMQLVAETIDGRTRIVLADMSAGPHEVRLDRRVFRSILRELDTLRIVSERLPYPIWRQTQDGHITWANRAYRERSDKLPREEGALSWPPARIFPNDAIEELALDGNPRRLTLIGSKSEDEHWYECRSAQVGNEVLMSAINIDAAVQAERQLRDFMQTLTKTFSHLTTGLAVFDRHRRLALFNPALTDLTGLPIDFLAGRPTLYAVLDRLRDRRMIPEPKDWGSWRQQIAELEAAAADGTYSETWSLPDNRTYRVTGRPHPGGAVAFLFEDISAEMSLTRRFRSELELGQAIIDALEEAIIVFSPNGTLSTVNRAYQEMWDTDVADTVDIPTVTEISRSWMARSIATPVWGDIRDFVLHQSDRSSWEDEIPMSDGSTLSCRVLPLTGGSTMVSFQRVMAPRVVVTRTGVSG